MLLTNSLQSTQKPALVVLFDDQKVGLSCVNGVFENISRHKQPRPKSFDDALSQFTCASDQEKYHEN